MNTVKAGRNYLCSIRYHIVWCVKGKHEIISDEIKESLVEIIKKIVNDRNIGLLKITVEKSYIHVLVECSPQDKIPNIIKALKGVSGRLILQKYPYLKQKLSGASLWNSNYFIATPSQYIEQQIQTYLKYQDVKGRLDG